MTYAQINSAKNAATSDRVIPEMQNLLGNSTLVQKDTDVCTSS